MAVESLITQHIDTWTSAVKTKSTTGRGSSKKLELYGVKKLRELILELAVRGKLVPQDPNDEPASVLLERIEKIKAQLVKDKKIKKPKKSIEVSDDEKPFDIPKEWRWVRLSEYAQIFSGNAFKSGDFSSEVGTKTIKITNAGVGHLIETEEYLPADFLTTYSQYRVVKNDLILALTRPYISDGLKVSMCPHSYHNSLLNQRVVAIRAYVNPEYAFFILRSPYILNTYKNRFGGNGLQPNLKMSDVTELVIPLCSEQEQHRIVAKVDELMTLCDHLEQQTEASIEAHQLLVSTLLNTLTNSADADELMENWARISDHFDTLFTTEESIDQLKQTILQLAVMGKLVPQDPNDEPASVLLERIALHQQLRIKNKEIQKPKKVVIDDTLDLETPSGWHQVLLNDLVFVTKLAGFEYTKYINLEDAGDVAVIRAQNVRPFSPDLENLKYIDKETSLNLPRSAIDRPALLVTFIGAGIGDVCVFNRKERWHLAPNVAKVEPYADLNLHYLCIYLNSPIGRKELFKSMKSTAQPSLSMTTIREIWVKLPPCTEQVKIVKVVESLFSTCEQLKKRLKESQVTQLHLTDAIIEQAV
ncbi:TPA: restriction endonuclease subunit S [Photobacterium damselae]